MEDKSINDINNALNSLQKDEEQIKQEIEKLQGKYEFENGKFVEPKEVTQYKKDLERVQKEIEEKNSEKEKILAEKKRREINEKKLMERKEKLMRKRSELNDENLIKKLKENYINNPNADPMTTNFLEQTADQMIENRKKEIDIRLSEIERIMNLPEVERSNIDIDEWLKEIGEKNSEEQKETENQEDEEQIEPEEEAESQEKAEDPIEPEEEAESQEEAEEPIESEEEVENQEENEEPIESEEEVENQEENEEPIEPDEEDTESQEENEEETKQMLAESIDKEIDKINQVLKKYEELENEINELSEPFDVDMEQKINSQKKEFKDLKLSIGKLSIKKQTLEAMKELVEKDVKQAKKEYEEYENKSEENDKEIEQIEETIERLDVKQKEIADEYEKKEEEIKERFTNSIDDIIAEFEDILEGYEYINDKVSEVRENVGFIGFFGKETDKEVIKKVFEEADAEVTKKIKSINKLKNKLISIKKLAETDLNAAWNEMSNEEEELDSIETESVKEQIIELGQLCDEIKKYKEYIQTETEAYQQFNFEKSEEINKIADLIKNSTDMDIGEINDLRLRIGKIRIELVRGNDIRDNKEKWCELAKGRTNLTDFLEEIKHNMEKYMEEYKKEREKEISELREAIKGVHMIEPEEFDDEYYFDDEDDPESADGFEEHTENPSRRSEEAQFEPNEEEEWYENPEPDEEEELGENEDDSEEHKDTQRKISKAKKISRTLGKIGRGISRFKETGVFGFVYNILDKLANKIVPLEISEGEERRNDENSLEEQLKAGDEEYNKRSSGESEKVVNINRSREYRRKQRVSREQLNPIEHKNKDSKDKEKQKGKDGPDKD